VSPTAPDKQPVRRSSDDSSSEEEKGLKQGKETEEEKETCIRGRFIKVGGSVLALKEQGDNIGQPVPEDLQGLRQRVWLRDSVERLQHRAQLTR